MPLASTKEQRIAATIRVLCLRGASEAEATEEAYRREGLAPPKDADAEIERLEREVEELHWQLSCERRRADACAKRAGILLRRLRSDRVPPG